MSIFRSVGFCIAVMMVTLPQLACTSHTRKQDSENIAIKQDLKDLISAQESLTSRLSMLANRLSKMEDRLAVQEARTNVTLPELPIVKLVPKPTPPAVEAPSIAAITQGDVDNTTREESPPIARLKPKKTKPTVKKTRPVANAKRRVTPVVARQIPRRKEVLQPKSEASDPKGMIAQATKLVNQRKYGDARLVVAEFYRRYPRSFLKQYAMLIEGRAYFGQGGSLKAIKVFERLIAQFPGGRTVPDALYMIGLSQDRLGQTSRAVETLARLKTIYPATKAGKRAAAALSNRQQSL